MAPTQEEFGSGDLVEVKASAAGTWPAGRRGELVRKVGPSRWAIKVQGEGKTRMITEDHLELIRKGESNAGTGNGADQGGAGAAPSESYSIIGTWVNWLPAEMTWNAAMRCFEFPVLFRVEGSQSFKILQNGDWEACLYPDCMDANPYVPHKVLGPDSAGLEYEWTIGAHPADEAQIGACYTVQLFLANDNKPARVTWALTNKAAKPAFREPFPLSKPVPMTLRATQEKDLSADLIKQEVAARRRLEERFKNMNMLPILNDEEEDADKPERLQILLAQDLETQRDQVNVNLRRYREAQEEYERVTMAYTVTTADEPDFCTECGKSTIQMVGGQYNCAACLDAYENLRADGWNGNALCAGVPAVQRAQWLFQKNANKLTFHQARLQIMSIYPRSFMPE